MPSSPAPPVVVPPPITTSFEVRVSKEAFKFNAAHFVAFQGFREKLHGHNYQVGVKLLGSRNIGRDGYVVDFGDIKAVTKKVCKDMNEHFLCPTLSDVLDITVEKHNGNKEGGGQQQEHIKIVCEDGAMFLFPLQDCAMLPIVHATTEELAIYLWGKILNGLDASFLRKRGIHTMEVTVAEAIGQEATFRYQIPDNIEAGFALDVRHFIEAGEIIATPCLPDPNSNSNTTSSSPNTGTESNAGNEATADDTANDDASTTANSTAANSNVDEMEVSLRTKTRCACDGTCQASESIFSKKLQKIADCINSGSIEQTKETGCKVTTEALENMARYL